MSDENPMTELSTEECWDLLRDEQLGRLAFRVVDEVHITPVNYAVHDGTLLFLSGAGTKLLGIVMGSQVAFEIDHHDEDQADSVVVRGTARLLEEDEAHVADHPTSLPWVTSPKYNVVQVVPDVVTGRRFEISIPA